jgi:hypothetical protein
VTGASADVLLRLAQDNFAKVGREGVFVFCWGEGGWLQVGVTGASAAEAGTGQFRKGGCCCASQRCTFSAKTHHHYIIISIIHRMIVMMMMM